jgi:MFS family permease
LGIRIVSNQKSFPPAALAWSVWGLGALLYLIGFYQRVAPGVITDRLMTEFAIGGAALGNLSGFYFYSYVAMQIPTGMIADRWGPRRLLTVGAGVAPSRPASGCMTRRRIGAGSP